MPITLNGDTGIQTPMYNGTITANAVTPSVNMKNRIINGAMVIDQRNAGAVFSGFANGAYTLDRWRAFSSQASKYTVQQNAGSVTPPAGFNFYYGVTSSSAYSITSTDLFIINQKIEGFNTADLNWGTANAKTVTLSFWVRSSLTGTFGGALNNSAENYSYPFTYTISAANTWEYKTVTVAGPTAGTWIGATNGVGMNVWFGLGVGSTYSGTAGSWSASGFYSATGATSVVGTNGATFYITGVQLEVGSTATSFDYRPYTTELQLCQRYYYKLLPAATDPVLANGYCVSTTTARLLTQFLVSMRTNPTALEQTGTAGNYSIYNASGETACSAVPTFLFASTDSAASVFTVASGLTAGQGLFGITNSTTSYLAWSAEL
jgi:hypothetical protein